MCCLASEGWRERHLWIHRGAKNSCIHRIKKKKDLRCSQKKVGLHAVKLPTFKSKVRCDNHGAITWMKRGARALHTVPGNQRVSLCACCFCSFSKILAVMPFVHPKPTLPNTLMLQEIRSELPRLTYKKLLHTLSIPDAGQGRVVFGNSFLRRIASLNLLWQLIAARKKKEWLFFGKWNDTSQTESTCLNVKTVVETLELDWKHRICRLLCDACWLCASTLISAKQ